MGYREDRALHRRTFGNVAKKNPTVSEEDKKEALKKAQEQFSEFTEKIRRITQLKQNSKPFVANRVKIIVSNIRNLLKTAEKDPSELSTNGKEDDLSAAAYDACMVSAKMRLHLLNNLSQGSSNKETPQSAREIESKTTKIKDLLNYAGANGCELDPNGKTINEITIAKVALYANERSAELRVTEVKAAAKSGRIAGIVQSVFLDALALQANYDAAEELAKKHSLPSVSQPDGLERIEIIDAFKTTRSNAERSEVAAMQMTHPSRGFKSNLKR